MTIHLPDTIKFIITDFDGILTDNCVYIDSKGEMSRKLNFKDIMAVSMLTKNGYQIGIVSGEENAAIELIKKTFGIKEVHQKIRKKLEIVKSIIDKYNLSDDEYVYIGDDVNDYDTLCNAKFKITVPGAVDKIKQIKNIQITSAKGGDGAFREIADTILENT